jgi:hypothetical protein
MIQASQRTNGLRFLENLAYLVPSFRGYRQRDLRREEDSRLRARVTDRIHGMLEVLETVHNHWHPQATPASLEELDRQRLRLMTMCTAVRQGPYDHWSFFETDALREGTIERILESDLLILQDLEETELQAGSGNGIGTARGAGPYLRGLSERLDALEQHLIMRERVLASA